MGFLDHYLVGQKCLDMLVSVYHTVTLGLDYNILLNIGDELKPGVHADVREYGRKGCHGGHS